MIQLYKIMDIKKFDVVSIIGSGGKTTIMELLANSCTDFKVLISTTTKIFIPKNQEVISGNRACLSHHPHLGIQYLGNQNIRTNKLETLDLKILKSVIPRYDLVLLEADGSKLKPLKAWRENEPIIVEETTKTIGVISIKVLNKVINEENIHNIELFLVLTNSKIDDMINNEVILQVVSKGLFKKSRGKKILIINQVESNQEKDDAIRLVKIINEKKLVDQCIVGSCLTNNWRSY